MLHFGLPQLLDAEFCLCAADAEEGGGDGGEGVLCVPHADLHQDVCCVPQWCPGLLQVLPKRRPQHLSGVRTGFQTVIQAKAFNSRQMMQTIHNHLGLLQLQGSSQVQC